MRLVRLLVAYPADASAFVDKPLHGALTGKRDVGMLQGTLPHAVFEEPTTVAGNIKPEVVRLAHGARGRKCFTTSGRIESEFGIGATTHGTKGVQLLVQAGIQRRHDLLPHQQQPVDMIALGNRFVNPRPGANVVSFEDGDSVTVVGEYPRGH